ncbi:MAG: heavy metal transport/detoxification protein [Cyanobacteria bacterium CRU_2_1]|nr:heavy metal transport/detoxification protein [Cyanobacteria bacterium RU_5_0]NJR62071.1 heavy metal transport/detoxification protein [Cyanobacteria bacterium CRU_2_1]
MALKLNVPTIDGSDSAKYLWEMIITAEPEAKVEIDPTAKTVTIESEASEETFKQVIEAAGHKIA